MATSRMTRAALPLTVAALLATTLAACNTIRGAGRDIEAGGEAVTRTATEVQQDLAKSKAEQDAQAERDRQAQGGGAPK
jgi:predicted small secreted protein